MSKRRPSWAGRETEVIVISIHGAQKNKAVSDKIELSEDLAALSKDCIQRRKIICFVEKLFSGISSK